MASRCLAAPGSAWDCSVLRGTAGLCSALHGTARRGGRGMDRLGTARHGKAKRGLAAPGQAWLGVAVKARLGSAVKGRARCGIAVLGRACLGRRCKARHGKARSSWARRGVVAPGTARQGQARRGMAGDVLLGTAEQGDERHSKAGSAEPGRERPCTARLGMAQRGSAKQGRRGWARRCVAKHGRARLGPARRSSARQACHGVRIITTGGNKMATATGNGTTETAAPKRGRKPAEVAPPTIMQIPELEIRSAILTVEGISPLIMHKWSTKAEELLVANVTGAAKEQREPVVPEEAWKDSAYVIPGHEEDEDWKPGKYYFPGPAFKHAYLYGVSQIKDTKNFPKTQATGWVYIDDDPVLTFKSVQLRRDIGRQPVQPIYRPQFNDWGCDLLIGYNARAITIEQAVSLFDLGGFSGGIGEWRPSSPKNKSGSFGRFRITSVRHVG